MVKFIIAQRCGRQLKKQVIIYMTIVGIMCMTLWLTLVAPHPHTVAVKPSQKTVRRSRNQTWNYKQLTGNNAVIYSDYFKPKREVVNPYPYKRIIQPLRLCADEPFLVILVCSIHSHTNVRDSIRDTWGSAGHGSTWPGNDVRLKIKVIFLFGNLQYPTEHYILSQENRNYNDILQGSFKDSYNNLSNKMLMGLRFVADECPTTQYILKADEDTFTNVQSVYEFLQSKRPTNSVVGHIYNGGDVRRLGKWAISSTVYPFRTYPYYAAGNAYVLSSDLIRCMVRTSPHLPYVSLEDVFITGILGAVCHAHLIDVAGFTYWDDIAPTPNDFVKGDKLTANKVSPGLAREIWAALLEASHNITSV